MNEETIVEFSEPLAKEIERFLQEHGLTESVEDFIARAGRSRLEQLASRVHTQQPQRAQARDEEYSHDAVERALGALNKTEPPMTDQEKSETLKGLAAGYRRLKFDQGDVDRGIQ